MRLACFTNWRGRAIPCAGKCRFQIRYEDLTIDNGYRVDLLVRDLVVIELKAIESILPVHRAQLLSYLKLGRFRLGYLLNFHVAHMRDGIVRMVDGLVNYCVHLRSLRDHCVESSWN